MTAYVGRRRDDSRAQRLRSWTTILFGVLCLLVILAIPLGLLVATR